LAHTQKPQIRLGQKDAIDLRGCGKRPGQQVLQSPALIQLVSPAVDQPAQKFNLIGDWRQMVLERQLDRLEGLVDIVTDQLEHTGAVADQLRGQHDQHGDKHQPADGDAERRGDGPGSDFEVFPRHGC